MKRIFLLGAGASYEAGVPVAFDMTKRMLNTIESDPELSQITHMLRFIVGGLMFQKGIRGDDPGSGVNIEDLFNTVNELRTRDSNSLAPFISSWHPLLDNFDRSTPTSFEYSKLLDSIYRPLKTLLETGHQAVTNEELVQKLSKPYAISSDIFFEQNFETVIHTLVSSSSDQVLTYTSEILLKKLIKMVWINDPNKVSYLTPLLKIAQRENSTIATLNYDNSIELAGQSANIGVDSGIDSWLTREKFIYLRGGVALIKLHGSIDWESSQGSVSEEKPLSHNIVRKKEFGEIVPGEFNPMVVFGGKNKLTTKGPFMALLRAFELKLKQSNQLIIIGYSFGDDHINDLITNWINHSSTRQIIIIDPKFQNIRNVYANSLKKITNNRVILLNSIASEGIKKLQTQFDQTP